LSTAAIRRGIRVDNPNTQEEALRARAQAEYTRLKERMRGRGDAPATAAPGVGLGDASSAASRPSGDGAGRPPGNSASQSGNSATQSRDSAGQSGGAGGPQSTADQPNQQAATDKQTIGSLVADLSSQASTLVRGELEYAQANLKAKVKNLGIGGVHLGIAAFIGLYATGMLFVTLALVLAIWLPMWAGFLIVTVVLVLVAGFFALLGAKKFKASQAYKVSPGKGFGKDVAAFKNGLKN
jgi:Protein of unknown function (DUF1469).